MPESFVSTVLDDTGFHIRRRHGYAGNQRSSSVHDGTGQSAERRTTRTSAAATAAATGRRRSNCRLRSKPQSIERVRIDIDDGCTTERLLCS